MRKIFFVMVLAIFMLHITSCKKSFNSLQNDTNHATSVPPNLVLGGILSDINSRPFSEIQRWNQFYCCNYAYYGDQQYTWTNVSFDAYATLNNVKKMEEEASKSISAPNAYTAIGKFLRAYLFYELTMKVGDVPLTESLQSVNNTTPKYDNQKNVFKQILAWLDEANNEMNTLISKNDYLLSGDIYYKNDITKWKKAVNAFKLRVLIQLSKYENDTDLNIKQKFAEVIANANLIFKDMNENMSYVYNAQYNKYPTNPDSYGFDVARYNMSATYLNMLVSYKDPRTFVVAEPADSLVRAGAMPNSFQAFNGASSGEDLATMSANAGKGLYSFINRKRYYSTYTAEDCILLGYPEMCFNIAEAINRGWVAGSAEDWYKKGIQASIAFYGITNGANNVYFQKIGGGLSDYNTYSINFDWTTYYDQSSIKYSGNNQSGLTQILNQKYIAFYQNSDREAYYNWRRTGVPTFLTGAGTGNSNRVALRYQYPIAEKSINVANVNSAIQNQYAGNDDINGKMWIIK